MITAVSLNPSIDKTISIAEFVYGGMNRAISVREDLAGKAINVAVVAASLGVQTECIGFLYNENGRQFENMLMRHGVQSDFIWLDGRVRTNVKLLDESKGIVTEINEAGSPVSEEALRALVNLVIEHAAESDFLILTGSLPPGCPRDFYNTLIESVEGLNCRTVLDADGEALKHGIAAKPFLIKPNLRELEMVAGHALKSIEEIVQAARNIIARGIALVAVSMGDRGALLVGEEEALYAPPIRIKVGSTVGAGDSMVSGLVTGLLADYPLEKVFRMGVASATASVMMEGTKLVEKNMYKRLLDEITVKRVGERW